MRGTQIFLLHCTKKMLVKNPLNWVTPLMAHNQTLKHWLKATILHPKDKTQLESCIVTLVFSKTVCS